MLKGFFSLTEVLFNPYFLQCHYFINLESNVRKEICAHGYIANTSCFCPHCCKRGGSMEKRTVESRLYLPTQSPWAKFRLEIGNLLVRSPLGGITVLCSNGETDLCALQSSLNFYQGYNVLKGLPPRPFMGNHRISITSMCGVIIVLTVMYIFLKV